MLDVSFGEILDAKVVNEGGASGLVTPKAWSKWHGCIAIGCQFLDELIESNNPGFFEAVHTSTNFEIYVPVVCDLNVVAWVVPDFLGND